MLEKILKQQQKFDVFIFDLFGVIWDGKKIINSAPAVLQKLKELEKEIIILSNASVRSYEVEKAYIERGLLKGIHYDSITTSGDLAYDVFTNDKRALKYYTIFRPNPELFVDSKYKETTNLKDADFVYIGIPQFLENGTWQNSLTIEPFEEELQKLHKMGKTLICVNPDLKAHKETHEEAVICQGAIALYYQKLGGTVEFIGKPYPEVFDFALRDCEADDSRILMIGDTLETDILGANAYGIKSALIATGISYENMLAEELSDIKEYAKALDIEPNIYL